MIACPDPAVRPRVLIVDESADNREVLRTVLERRGVEIFEAAEGREGADLMQQVHPELIVLDEGAAGTADIGDSLAAFWRDSGELIVLGKSRRRDDLPEDLPKDRILTKPYHFAPLILKIEQLLRSARP